MRRRAGWSSPCAALVCALGLASAARAQPPSSTAVEATFAQASARLDAFEYAEAVALLTDLVARQPPAEVELRARALIVRAEASRGEDEAARAAAASLYRRDPGFELSDDDSLSPRIRAYFVEAQRRARARPPEEISVRTQAADSRVRVRLSSTTPAMVDRVIVGVRSGDGDEEHPARPAQGGGYEVLLPRAPALRYYARFFAPSGYVVAEAGSPEVPLSWTESDAVASAGGSAAAPLGGVGAAADADADEGDLTALFVGLGVGAAIVAAALTVLLLWQPWSDGPTLSRGLELP